MLNKLGDLVKKNRITVISSPAGTGKTSLLQIYMIKLSTEYANVKLFYVQMPKGVDPYDRCLKNGFDINLCKVEGKDDIIVLLDDCQNVYNNKKFWYDIVKDITFRNNSRVRFVVSATYLLRGVDSPVELQSIPAKITHQDMLLSFDESVSYINYLNFRYVEYNNLINAIVLQCGGLIAALHIVTDLIMSNSKNFTPSEDNLIKFFLSTQILPSMERCFGSGYDEVPAKFKDIICQLLHHSVRNTNPGEYVKLLETAGVIIQDSNNSYTFSSTISKRYFCNIYYPNRAESNPETLVGLIKRAIGSMSANDLRNCVQSDDFPKEAVFQHLLMCGLTKNLKSDVIVQPELSKLIDPITYQHINIQGEIDFYINSNLQWGIELLVQGSKITEHLSRFASSGKYYNLNCNDYYVVDFRGNQDGKPTNITYHEKRITAFFQLGNYNVVNCIVGLDRNIISIPLKH